MRSKVLILSIYPAPYRVQLFERISMTYDVDVFFEHSNGDDRNIKWFFGGEYFLLDSKAGHAKFAEKKNNLKSYDLVALYDYSTKESIKLILACRRLRIPYIINCDGIMLSSHGNVVREVLKKFLISGAAGCLASGENARNYFLKYGAGSGNIFLHTFSTLHSEDILSTPVNKSEKASLREKLGLPTNKKIVIAVGRFIPLKRYGELICAWAHMPDDIVLLLVGGGAEEANYRMMIDNTGLTNVIIEQFHPKNELFEYYKASDLFVHPTSYDVWGLVVNEAMACGLPVVVSDHCVAGLELVKQECNGYVVPLDQYDELLQNILKILKDEELYEAMANNCLTTIRPYTIENMAHTQIDAFREILLENVKHTD